MEQILTSQCNPKQLPNNPLHEKLKSLVKQERELLAEILETIKNIDSQKLYLGLGYSSLFAYLVEGIGYSPSSAQRRIDAARLMRQIPSVVQKIESGALKLNQISLVQKEIREIEKVTSEKISIENKNEILQKIQGQSFEFSQKEVAQFFNVPIRQYTLAKHQADESVRIEVTLDKETYELFKQAQDLLSNSVPSGEVADFIKYVSKKIIQQKLGKSGKAGDQLKSEGVKSASVLKSREIEKSEFHVEIGDLLLQKTKTPKVDAAAVVRSVNDESKRGKNVSTQRDNRDFKSQINLYSRTELQIQTQLQKSERSQSQTFTLKTKKLALENQKCCQYKDPLTGRQCQSTRFLQVDHRHSQWAGGSSQLENAQILCASHNRFKYLLESGVRKLE